MRLMNNHGRSEVTTAARRELQFLSDPLKLAQAVGEKLRKSQFDAALNLVRESDRGVGVSRATIDNTVSWNHLIDWLMQQNQPNDAWKIYNEV
jgi:pentatricopeptide repeat protein